MTPLSPQTVSQLKRAESLLQEQLGPTLLAIHLLGSAVDGGLAPQSDLDVLVTVTEPLPQAARPRLMRELLEVSAWPATRELRPLEVTLVVKDEVIPWRYPPQRELQFGEWLRGEILADHEFPSTPDPDLAILLTKVRECSTALFGPEAVELFHRVPSDDLRMALFDTLKLWNSPSDWQGDERNVVLTLARIWYTLSTHKIASKDRAADWAIEHLPEPHRRVLQTARSAYLGEYPDDLAARPNQIAGYVEHLRSLALLQSQRPL